MTPEDTTAAAQQLTAVVTDSCWLGDTGEAAGKLAGRRVRPGRLGAKLERVLRDASGV